MILYHVPKLQLVYSKYSTISQGIARANSTSDAFIADCLESVCHKVQALKLVLAIIFELWNSPFPFTAQCDMATPGSCCLAYCANLS